MKPTEKSPRFKLEGNRANISLVWLILTVILFIVWMFVSSFGSSTALFNKIVEWNAVSWFSGSLLLFRDYWESIHEDDRGSSIFDGC